MTYEAARRTIQDHVASSWTGTPSSRIAYENLPFQPPSAAPWLRLTIRHGEARAASLGGPTRRYRRFGSAILQIFVPEGTGPTLATQLADEAMLLFEGQRLTGGVVFSGLRVREVGVEDGWFQINVSAAFSFDDLH